MLTSLDNCRGEISPTEEQGGIKTVECLRGRLLAERMASKKATAEADYMARRIAELERQLLEEMEYRGKAEKKLKHALKKLESFMVLDFADRMDLSDSSVSSSSPNKCFRSNQGLDKWRDLGQCGSSGSMNSFCDSAHQLISQDGSCISVGTASSWNKEPSQGDEMNNTNGSHELADDSVRPINEHQPSYKMHKICEENFILSSQSVKDELHFDGSQAEQPIDECLALVLVSNPPEPAACNPQKKNNVYDVISALRHAREQLKSIGRTASS